mmetsp:Transcript_22046/g.32575  ORF Transcript_22046/g.32575 Transcript_22046/m.32575 type:complete len:266 (-) Transcript_22046:215-1012(-)|eukprot:CAMPEP_0194258210 /NCGR_PEP_ID=MMETSP0158-20130606/40746_1 /TAXON_ID=33649 /ORGANISM="Thalassionema nitzschioides, Strain L26-B" /LENGTH=265 /DNA_ID=CAMNT_0038997529 /DNA_START=8 /DNA_END=808 /DNA_ORIENTATION=+
MSIIQYILDDPVILPSGAFMLASHLFLFVVFKYLCPEGPWKQMPSFTAHQAVAFVAMIYQTYLGFLHFHDYRDIFGENAGGIYISQFCVGSMLVWDIPVGLVSDGMGDMIMHVHHIGFFLMASVTMGYFSNGEHLGSAYAPFFFGIIELSSIPLQIVDLFHPKQKPWHAYMNQYPTLQSLNEICRVLFALLFVLTRMLAFPYFTVTSCITDFWKASQDRPEFSVPCKCVAVANTLFMLLQLYWGMLLIKQITKALGGGKKDKKED